MAKSLHFALVVVALSYARAADKKCTFAKNLQGVWWVDMDYQGDNFIDTIAIHQNKFTIKNLDVTVNPNDWIPKLDGNASIIYNCKDMEGARYVVTQAFINSETYSNVTLFRCFEFAFPDPKQPQFATMRQVGYGYEASEHTKDMSEVCNGKAGPARLLGIPQEGPGGTLFMYKYNPRKIQTRPCPSFGIRDYSVKNSKCDPAGRIGFCGNTLVMNHTCGTAQTLEDDFQCLASWKDQIHKCNANQKSSSYGEGTYLIARRGSGSDSDYASDTGNNVRKKFACFLIKKSGNKLEMIKNDFSCFRTQLTNGTSSKCDGSTADTLTPEVTMTVGPKQDAKCPVSSSMKLTTSFIIIYAMTTLRKYLS